VYISLSVYKLTISRVCGLTVRHPKSNNPSGIFRQVSQYDSSTLRQRVLYTGRFLPIQQKTGVPDGEMRVRFSSYPLPFFFGDFVTSAWRSSGESELTHGVLSIIREFSTLALTRCLSSSDCSTSYLYFASFASAFKITRYQHD
jgi:hypothetical protein